jgi:NitT/TauT family transport system substrate-binding protein
MNPRLFVARACALVAFTVALTGAAVRPAAADDDTLTLIGGSYPTALFEVFVDVAEHAGFYKEQHLKVNVQYAGNPAVAIQAVAAGKGDIASINISQMLTGYAKGVRMTAFLARGPRLQGVLGVLDSSKIRTLADFKGATIGETTIGQPGEIFTRVMLAGAGLHPGDFSFAPVGSGAQAVGAITGGKVDALTQPYPALRIYEVTANVKFRYFFQPILSDVPDDAFVATPQTIATKGDLLKRFSRAIVEAAILTRVNPELAAKYFAMDSGLKVTPQAIQDEINVLHATRDLLDAADPTSPRIGDMPLRGMKLLTKFMYDNGLTPTLVPAEAEVTEAFIPYANAFDHKAFIAKVKALR